MSALAGCRALVGARLPVTLVADSGAAPLARGFVQVSAGIHVRTGGLSGAHGAAAPATVIYVRSVR
jgi:hypothetical protein